jgi:hypothetical protein
MQHGHVAAEMLKLQQTALERPPLHLKDPLIFRQCIHLRDVAVLLNRDSYVEQYD